MDANQDYLNNGLYGIASGMKRVDNGTYAAIKAVVDGTFAGEITSLGLAEGGVGISNAQALLDFINFGVQSKKIDASSTYTIMSNWAANRANVPYWIWEAVDELNAAILAKTIIVPTADTKAEMEAVRVQYPLK